MSVQNSVFKNCTIIGTTAVGLGAVGVLTFRNREYLIEHFLSDNAQNVVKAKFIETLSSMAVSAAVPIVVRLTVKIVSPLEHIFNSYKIVFYQALDIPAHEPDSASFKFYKTPPLRRSLVDIERKELIESLLVILGSTQTPSVLLTGLPGVGKSSLVRSLVGPLEESQHPALKGARIKPLELTDMKQYELKELLEQAKISRLIIYIDEFNTILKNDEQLRDTLKTMLEDKDARIIACTTAPLSEIDAAFLRRFTIVPVPEPQGILLTSILKQSVSRFEEHHQCVYDETSIQYCIQKTKTLPGNQPAKAIRVLDQAGSTVWLSPQENGVRPKVTNSSVDRAVIVYSSAQNI